MRGDAIRHGGKTKISKQTQQAPLTFCQIVVVTESGEATDIDSRLVGVDIIPEAQVATERDRPGVYDAYYLMDFCSLDENDRDDLKAWSLDCLVSVAALGFGDIPAQAFLEAFNMIGKDGWIAFNVKETFFDRSDDSGFSQLIRELIFSEYLDLHHLQRYRHRFSIEGEPLYYFALGGRKTGNVSSSFADSLDLSA